MSATGQVSYFGMAPSLLSLPLPLLLVLCAVLHPAAASGGDLLMLDRFHRWMTAHGRTYPSAQEKLRRLEVYRRNVELIEAMNRESARLGYELGENEFTDLTNEEFMARYTGAAVPREDGDAMADGMGPIITTLAGDVSEGSRASIVDLNATAVTPPPLNFDWRDKGVVTPAKAQGRCGCCWAFATVATVESLNKIKGGQLLDLSEQELLDCDVADQHGCKGGYIEEALNWIKSKGGAVTEATYPYKERQGQCKDVGSATRYGKITGARRVRGEPQMKLAVLERPVGVLIDARGAILQNYKTGIYKGPCTTMQNHAVVLIGYGVTNTGEEYWILKNSWGSGWGQKGFFFMRRGADGVKGLCGIAVWGTYPLM
uniref:Uncharacterized protein n=1 Tax=Avena sativa TaxID=4498 RepID=A0ACD5UVV0_AVESA